MTIETRTSRTLRRVLLAAGAGLLLQQVAHGLLAHGGTYQGPGGGAPGGGGAGPADTAPPGGGGGSASSGSAAGGGGSGGAGGNAPASPTCRTTHTGSLAGLAAGADENAWERWWRYNQAAFLDVKAAIHASDLAPGSDAFFLGHAPPDHARDRLVPTTEAICEYVVPALRAALQDERDNDVVTGALIALAKIGEVADASPSAAALFTGFLADPNQEIAETAALSLGILGSPGAVPVLVALLADEPLGRRVVGHPPGVPLRTRAFAAYGLGLIGHRTGDSELQARIVEVLVRQVDGPAERLATPDVAVACLSAIGLVPLPFAGPAGADGLAPWQAREAQVEWLLARTDDPALRDWTRAHAPTAAARLLAESPRGAEAAALRERALRSWCAGLAPHAKVPRLVQPSLVLALGAVTRAGEDPLERLARAALLDAARRGHVAEVRNFALVSLGEVAGRPGAGADPWEGVDEVRVALLREIERGAGPQRPWAAVGLGVLGRRLLERSAEPAPEVDAALRAALAEARSPRELGAYAVALGMRRDGEAVGALLAKLPEAGTDDARGNVVVALGMIGVPAALPAVREVVARSLYRPTLLQQGAIGLGLLGDKGVVSELCGMLERADSLSAQASLANGLGAIGDARSIEPLVAMLGDREITPRARAFAAVALGIVADKESRPWNAKLAVGINYRANTTTLTDGQGAGVLEIL